MEIGVREVLIVVVGLVILAILLDGLRRAYESKKYSLKVSLGKRPDNEEAAGDLPEFESAELPGSGKSRVLKAASETSLPEDFDESIVDEIDLSPLNVDVEGVNVDVKAESVASEGRPPVDVEKADAHQDVIVINIVSRQKEIEGEDLLKVALNNGLRFGEMNAFHRADSLGEEGAKLFSMLNLVKPGSFDLDTMENLKTPGVCLFMVLPGPHAPRRAFDIMLEAANRMSSALDCELRDEKQNALSQQTIGHYRHRIDEFSRKQMVEDQADLVD